MPRRGTVVRRLRYTVLTKANEKSLRRCPWCHSLLTKAGSVEVELVNGSVAWDVYTRLDATGVLEDPDGLVACGLHGNTLCGSCGRLVAAHETVRETNLADRS